MEFDVTLTNRNLGGQTVKLSLQYRKADDQKWTDAGVQQNVKLDETGGTSATGEPSEGGKAMQSVTLEYEPKELGEFVYRAVAEARADERNVNDNAAEAPVTVTDAKINILLIGGTPSWEFQYLRNYLLGQPELYRLSVWQQNADPDVNQAASTGMKLKQLPRELNGT